VAWGGLTTIQLCDENTGQVQHTYREGLRSPVTALAFAADGKRLASASHTYVGLLDLATGDVLPITSPPEDWIESLAWTPDGKKVAAANKYGQIKVWDANSRRELQSWQLPGAVHGIACSPDGRHLAIANGNGTVYVLRLP
jgi:WD40 repeat protein